MDADFKAGFDANREYKDSVFTLLLSDEKALAEVYSAISGEDCGPDVNIKIATLKKCLSGGLFNDIAFMLDDQLVVLIEHQSTINENMPFRMMLYISEIYDRWAKDENLYGRKRFLIPRPVFIMFYNGAEDMPDQWELRLSDMFKGGADGQTNLELVVTVYNINKGHSLEILRRSPTLAGYATFIFMIRENEKTMSLEEAIKKAVIDCINQNVLKTFLENHKKEVVGMLTQEWNWGKAMEVAKKEGWEDGREEGRVEALIGVAKNLRANGMGVDDVAKATGLTVDDVLRL